MSNFTYARLADASAGQQLAALLAQCFAAPASPRSPYLDRIGIENFRVLQRRDRVIGGLGMIPMRQWYGGQAVEMTGIGGLGIAPDQRGDGAALYLIQSALQELHNQNVALSVLYPAVPRLYRQVGYEQGGSRYTWQISTQNLSGLARVASAKNLVEIAPISSLVAALEPIQQRQAKLSNGHLCRHTFLWHQIVDRDDQTQPYAYRLGTPDHPEGYLVFTQARTSTEVILQIRDWVVLTPGAQDRLWHFLASHRSQVDVIQWVGAAVDWLSWLLPNPPQVKSATAWALRIVSLKAALEQRGYCPECDLNLHINVQDSLLEGNAGNWILSVANGQGKVTAGGRGDLTLDIRFLAPLYSGWLSPWQLRLAGAIQGSDQTIAIAAQIFAGSPPWLPDFF